MSAKRIYRDDPIVARVKSLSTAELEKIAKVAGVETRRLQKLGLGEVDLSKPELQKVAKALGL